MLNSDNDAYEQIDVDTLNANDKVEPAEDKNDLLDNSNISVLDDSNSIAVLNNGVRGNKFVNLDVSDGKCVVTLDIEQPFDREGLLGEVKTFLKTIEKIESPEARHKARNLLASAFKLNISDLDKDDDSLASDSFFKKFTDYLDEIEKGVFKNSQGEDIQVKFSDVPKENVKTAKSDEDTSLLDGFKYSLKNDDWLGSEVSSKEVILSSEEANDLHEDDEELNE